jgi:hypothetical protein
MVRISKLYCWFNGKDETNQQNKFWKWKYLSATKEMRQIRNTPTFSLLPRTYHWITISLTGRSRFRWFSNIELSLLPGPSSQSARLLSFGRVGHVKAVRGYFHSVDLNVRVVVYSPDHACVLIPFPLSCPYPFRSGNLKPSASVYRAPGVRSRCCGCFLR